MSEEDLDDVVFNLRAMSRDPGYWLPKATRMMREVADEFDRIRATNTALLSINAELLAACEAMRASVTYGKSGYRFRSEAQGFAALQLAEDAIAHATATTPSEKL